MCCILNTFTLVTYLGMMAYTIIAYTLRNLCLRRILIGFKERPQEDNSTQTSSQYFCIVVNYDNKLFIIFATDQIVFKTLTFKYQLIHSQIVCLKCLLN